MSSLLRTLSNRGIPFVQQLEKNVSNPTQSLNQDIWRLRSEYWWRRVGAVPDTLNAAKSEIKRIIADPTALKIAKPGEWTYADLVKAGVIGVQLYGCFAIGEALARNKLIGYNIGNDHAHH